MYGEATAKVFKTLFQRAQILYKNTYFIEPTEENTLANCACFRYERFCGESGYLNLSSDPGLRLCSVSTILTIKLGMQKNLDQKQSAA